MWLPTPIYKRIPVGWFVAGLLFIAYSLYLGLDIKGSLTYVALGVVCCGAGVATAMLRARHSRDGSGQADSGSDNSDDEAHKSE